MRLRLSTLFLALGLAACSGADAPDAPADTSTAVPATPAPADSAAPTPALAAPATPATPVEALPKFLAASHILVQWQGSTRAAPTITRTKEEALARAGEVLTKLSAQGDFAALAAEYSDGPTSKRGGDLGQFPPGAMHPDFEAGLKEVAANTLVDHLVETPFGYHLIFRTE